MGFLSKLFGRDDTADQKAMKRRAQARRLATAQTPPPKPKPATFGKAGAGRKQPKDKN